MAGATFFDVGIKNLAYCLVRKDTSTNSLLESIDILHWGILDVSYKPLICKHIVNKRKICNKVSLNYILKDSNIPNPHDLSDNLIGYCKTCTAKLKLENKVAHKSLNKISRNAKYNDNFNIQMERLLSSLEKFYNNQIEGIYDIKNKNPNNFEYFISNLEIFIENQPVFKNPIMKSISIAIFTFFILKKVINPRIVKSVNFISAGEKTKPLFINKMKEYIDINVDIAQLKNYDKRKEFTITITNEFIKKLNNSVFNIISKINYSDAKKKDDFADTFIYVILVFIKNLYIL
jgi:hypothetical protein